MMNSLFTLQESPLYDKAVGETIEMEAEFTHAIYRNDLFIIAGFIDDSYDDFSVLGNVPFELKEGRRYRLTGVVEEVYSKFKKQTVRQLRLSGIVLLMPKGEQGILRYLQSLKGLNSRAFSLYDAFKDETLTIMKKDPERVAKEVRGISLKQALAFQEQLIEQEDASETMTFLLNLGLSIKECERIFKHHGDSVQAKIDANPYVLTQRYNGWPAMSFQRVDKLALSWGAKPESRERFEASVHFIFERQGSFGHCYSDWDTVVKMAQEALRTPKYNADLEDVEETLERLLMNNILHLDDDRLYIKRFFDMEEELAADLVSLAEKTSWRRVTDTRTVVENYLKVSGLVLEDKQRAAVEASVEHKGDMIIINGAAGTGKTFTAETILEVLRMIHSQEGNRKAMSVQILAPTGRASKVLKKALNNKYSTSTIHRALVPSDEGFYYDRSNQLTADVFLIDETSMLDTYLAHALMQAIPKGSKVIFLGDVRQLPAIGAGNVLSDAIKSGLCPVITLTVPKRQAIGSSIYENASRILSGQTIEPDLNDTFWFETNNAQQARLKVMHAVKNISSFDKEDIQILSPMRKGECGTHMLNYSLQALWNGQQPDSSLLNHTFEVNGQSYRLYFRIGDRVMQTVNTGDQKWVIRDPKTGEYTEDESRQGELVTNGEQGIIQHIFEETVPSQVGRNQQVTTMAVQFEDGIVLYRGNDKKDLDHAYAISIHKSQGSQWPVVIEVMDHTHYMMLSNELFYTGYSRASKKHILVSDKRSVDMALREQVVSQRRTSLDDRINERRSL